MLRERFRGIVEDPALLGAMLAAVYAIGLARASGGGLADRPLSAQAPVPGVVAGAGAAASLAAHAQGWALYALLLASWSSIFGAIPFTDAMIVRYVDDRMRSRVSGMRLTMSLGVSSLAVWLLGPVVKAAGFGALLLAMAASLSHLVAVLLLPRRVRGRNLSSRRRTRHHNRLAQRIEDARRRRDDLAGAQEFAAAGEVADAPAGLLDDQRARGDVPRT